MSLPAQLTGGRLDGEKGMNYERQFIVYNYTTQLLQLTRMISERTFGMARLYHFATVQMHTTLLVYAGNPGLLLSRFLKDFVMDICYPFLS